MVGCPLFYRQSQTYQTHKRVDALNNLTFISFSLIGFVIIFLLLRFLPRLKSKKGDRSSAHHSSSVPRLQATGPKRVYKI